MSRYTKTKAILFALLLLSLHPATSASPTRQELFDQASVALDKGEAAAALAGFSSLEETVAKKGSSATLTVIRLRKALALADLGREEEATSLLRANLPLLPAADTYLDDRLLSLLKLASMEEDALDWVSARRDYAAARDIATFTANKFRALTGIARTALFDDPQAARAAITDGLALLAHQDKAERLKGQLYTLSGRIRLNQGDLAGAREDLEKALRLLGGLTTKVSIEDIPLRGDLALAALLMNRKDAAREYLAYTGAGHLDEMGIITTVDFDLPDCGTDGIQPDDFAVVEFSILEDGTVGAARPVLGSRPGLNVLAFARKVQQWSWPSEKVKTIKPFFRHAMRLELRCSSAVAAPPASALFHPDLGRWLKEKGASPYVWGTKSSGERLNIARAAVAERRAKNSPAIDLIHPLSDIASTYLAPPSEQVDASRRIMEIVRANDAPGRIRAYFHVINVGNEALAAPKKKKITARSYADDMLAGLNDPVIAADPAARALVLLSAARVLVGEKEQALPLLQRIAEDKALPDRDPLKVGALVRIASIEARNGKLDAARAAFAATGLSAQQCALVDMRPERVNNPGSVNAYPVAASSWGFEGWTIVEFDIDANGATQKTRAVISYPPFVFDEASTDIIKKTRYKQSYRPAGAPGCGGKREGIRFMFSH